MTGEDQRRIVDGAMSWLGTPFHHRGRLKGVGVDCAMLVAEVFEKAGMIPHVNPPNYAPDHMKHHDRELLLEWVSKYFDPVESPSAGCVAVWKFGRTVSHIAIVIDWPVCIHANREGGASKFNAEIEIEPSRLRGIFIPKGI